MPKEKKSVDIFTEEMGREIFIFPDKNVYQKAEKTSFIRLEKPNIIKTIRRENLGIGHLGGSLY